MDQSECLVTIALPIGGKKSHSVGILFVVGDADLACGPKVPVAFQRAVPFQRLQQEFLGSFFKPGLW